MSQNPNMPENATPPSGPRDPVVGENIEDYLNPKIPQWGEPMDNPMPKYEGNAWKDVLEHVSEPDRGRCKAWKEEVETLLIFAGLFSAVVTAFIIESYKSLREDFGDTSTALLRRIALQLEGNGTANLPPASAFEPSSSSIRVNTLWFLSLILSLTTVLIGTLCLQWLREHLRLSPDARKAVPLQHMQEESLDRWYVPQIFTTLPILLQIAVIIFFVGIIDFLWQLHHTVAAVSLAFIGAAVIFYVVTTIAPTVQDCLLAFPRISTSEIPRSPCPYRSPQSFLFLQVVAPLVYRFIRRCIPMGWIWKLYWLKHDDRGCAIGRHWQESYHSVPVTKSTESWISHHTSWLLQRDLDVIFSRDLHQVDSGSRTIYARGSQPILFYDNIKALHLLLQTATMAESIAPWVCVEEYIRDSNRPGLKFFLNTVQDRQVINDPENLLPIDDEIREAFIFCTFTSTYNLPHLLLPYWSEKNFRVLGSLVSNVIATKSTVKQSVGWFETFDFYIPDTHTSYGQDIINTILTASSTTTWEFERQLQAAVLFFSLFSKLGFMVAENYPSSLSIRSRHTATLQLATSAIKTSWDSAAFLVVMASHYLLSFLGPLNAKHSDSAAEEAAELLSLIRSYREHHLGGIPENSQERSELLALQSIELEDMYFSYDADRPPPWAHYFLGMFDTSDSPTSHLKAFRSIFGSFLKPENQILSHPQQLGDSTPRSTIIDFDDNAAGASDQRQNESSPEAISPDAAVDEAVV